MLATKSKEVRLEVLEIAYCKPGSIAKVEFTIEVPAGTIFYRLVDADTGEILGENEETIKQGQVITRSFQFLMPDRNVWARLEVGKVEDSSRVVYDYFPFPIHTWYDVSVVDEGVDAGCPGDWVSYWAKISYKDGTPLPEDFTVQLVMGDYVVATVTLKPDVYNPDTLDLRIAFQVPTVDVGTNLVKLKWYGQSFSKDGFSFSIPPGESTGKTVITPTSIGVSVTNEKVEHPQAALFNVSYFATITDESGQPLPSRFYADLMIHSPTPQTVSFEDQFLGYGDGVSRTFYTKYKPIVEDSLKVYLDGSQMPSTEYTVDFSTGEITFNMPPPRGSVLTVDYQAILNDFPIAGVAFRKDVYYENKLSFSFKVPNLPAGTYNVWLEWADQIIGDKKYLAGESTGTTLEIIPDTIHINVTDERVEFEGEPIVGGAPGLVASYLATVKDENGNAIPPEVPFKLVFIPSTQLPIERYLKPLRIHVKNTGVDHEAFTKYFHIFDSGSNWARVGFEDYDEEIGETPDWDFDEPQLLVEVISATRVRITVEACESNYTSELWYGDVKVSNAVDVHVGSTFELDFEIPVSKVFLLEDVYNPDTFEVAIAFQVPELPVGTHSLKLGWLNQVVGSDKYVEGESTGFNFEVLPPIEVNVTEEKVEHPQAIGERVSYICTIYDEDGNPLPRTFYVELFLDEIKVAGVNLSEDVYNTEKKEARISFEVPDVSTGWHMLKLKWPTQTRNGKAFPSGESSGTKFGVTDDVRTVTATSGSIETPFLVPTLAVSYSAIASDNLENPLPETLPCELKLGDRIVSAFYLKPDVYDPTTKEVAVAFTVPEDIQPGTYELTLRWHEHVHTTPDNPLGTKYKEGTYTILVEVREALNVSVTDEHAEHPQAPNQWVSYIAKIFDQNGNALPESFYVRLFMDDVQVGGVNLKPDVYDPTTGEVKIAFQVPSDVSEGDYLLKLKWDTQVVDESGYMKGESAGCVFHVTEDVRTVYVGNEWVENPDLTPGEETSYVATVVDDHDEALPEDFATELYLDGVRVAAPSFKPDVYDPATRTAKIAFKVPADTSPGDYRVKLKWPPQVIGSTKYEGGESVGAIIHVW